MADSHLPLAFAKRQRLLSAIEFKAVFDDAVYKASHPSFVLLARQSSGGCARLGLVVGKRHVRRACRRNTIKRVARECFRLRQHQLPAVDTVLLIRQGADQYERAELRSIFNGLWKRIEKRTAQDRSSA